MLGHRGRRWHSHGWCKATLIRRRHHWRQVSIWHLSCSWRWRWCWSRSRSRSWCRSSWWSRRWCQRHRRHRWHRLRHLHLSPITDLAHYIVQPTFERGIVVVLRVPHRIPACQAEKVHLTQGQTEENHSNGMTEQSAWHTRSSCRGLDRAIPWLCSPFASSAEACRALLACCPSTIRCVSQKNTESSRMDA
jgi:hypothetical protein